MTEFTEQQQREMRDWERRKKQLVIETGRSRGYKTLIETGTCHGAMVEACLNYFRDIWSIEKAWHLYRECAKRFETYQRVGIIYGDSGKDLAHLLQDVFLDEPAIYWLDAHCSGGDTAGHPNDTTLQDELVAIFQYRKEGIILIDDQHLTAEEIAVWTEKYPGFVNEDNISRIDIATALKLQ